MEHIFIFVSITCNFHDKIISFQFFIYIGSTLTSTSFTVNNFLLIEMQSLKGKKTGRKLPKPSQKILLNWNELWSPLILIVLRFSMYWMVVYYSLKYEHVQHYQCLVVSIESIDIGNLVFMQLKAKWNEKGQTRNRNGNYCEQWAIIIEAYLSSLTPVTIRTIPSFHEKENIQLLIYLTDNKERARVRAQSQYVRHI